MFGIGIPELVIIIIVALLVVGPSKLPELAKSLGKALGEFRRMADDVKGTLQDEMAQATREDEKKEADKDEASKTGDKEGQGTKEEPKEASAQTKEHETQSAQTTGQTTAQAAQGGTKPDEQKPT